VCVCVCVVVCCVVCVCCVCVYVYVFVVCCCVCVCVGVVLWVGVWVCIYVCDRLVAIKIQACGARGSLEQEYNTLVALEDCPSVVQAFGFTSIPSQGFSALILQYIKGPSVSQVAKSLAVEDRRNFLQQLWPHLLKPVTAAHKRGVFHGDLKLDHFLFTTEAVKWTSPSPLMLIDWYVLSLLCSPVQPLWCDPLCCVGVLPTAWLS